MIKFLLVFLLTFLSTPLWAQTIPNASPLYNSYSCNSSTTQFPYSFYINSTSDMVVQLTDSLGNITFPTSFSVDTTNVWVNYPLVGSPCATGYTITIYASTPITQTTTYGNRTPFTATAVGSSLNKLTIIDQQLQRQLNQSLLLPVGQTAGTFPSSNPGYLIGWNSSGVLSNVNNPSVVAQWSLTGANIYYNLGNVGVMSSSPGEALDVNGTIRGTSYLQTGTNSNTFTGSTVFSGGNIGIGTDTTPDATLEVTQLTGTAPFMVSSTATTNGDYLSILNGGNVGIGSTNPGATLDVQGNARFLNGNIGIGSIVPGSKLDIQGNMRVFNGNVGIGSATPGLAVDVQGTVRATAFQGQTIGTFLNYGTSASVGTSSNGSNLKIAIGNPTPGSGSTINLSNLPFTSSTSYVCVCVDNSGSPGTTKTCTSTISSGSAATINLGANTEAMFWICEGT